MTVSLLGMASVSVPCLDMLVGGVLLFSGTLRESPNARGDLSFDHLKPLQGDPRCGACEVANGLRVAEIQTLPFQ